MKKFVQTAGTAFGTVATLFATTTASFAQAVPDIQPAGGTDIIAIITTITQWLFGLAGALAVVYLVYAGIQYITGGPKGAEAAKTSIINAIIGIAVIVLSYVIVNAVVGIFGG